MLLENYTIYCFKQILLLPPQKYIIDMLRILHGGTKILSSSDENNNLRMSKANE